MRCGGLPTDPPVSGTGLFKNFPELPLPLERYASIQCVSPSSRRIDVKIVAFESRTLDGMMEKPLGSGPIQETNCQLKPPSAVRATRKCGPPYCRASPPSE